MPNIDTMAPSKAQQARIDEIKSLSEQADETYMAKYVRTIDAYTKRKEVLIRKRDEVMSKKLKAVTYLNDNGIEANIDMSLDVLYRKTIDSVRNGKYIKLNYVNGILNISDLEQTLITYPKLKFILSSSGNVLPRPLDLTDGVEDAIKVIIDLLAELEQHYNAETIKYIKLVPSNDLELPKISTMFDNIDINCVIALLRDKLPKNSKTNKILTELNGMYFESGVNHQAMKDIARSLTLNINVKTITGKLWSTYKQHETKAFIDIICHNKHAHTPLLKSDTVVYVDNFDEIINKKGLKYVYGDVMPDKFLSGTNIRKENISCVQINNTYYKDKRIFYDDEDFQKNHNNKDLIRIKTMAGRKFKRITQYIRRKYDSKYTLDFMKAAATERSVYSRIPKSNPYGADQRFSYSSCTLSKYFTGFPDVPSIHTKLSKSNIDVLKFNGAAKITNVVNHLPKLYLNLQDDCVYNTVLLRNAYALGYATFDVVEIAYNPTPSKLDFEFIYDNDHKLENNTLIGLTQAKDKRTFVIQSDDDRELFALSKLHNNTCIFEDYMEITEDVPETLNYLGHVRSYILDIQYLDLLEVLVKLDPSKIVKIKTDAIYSTEPSILNFCKDDAKPGEFKQEFPNKMYDNDIDSITPVKTPFISEDISINDPELLLTLASSNRMLITGEAGTGKTYLLTQKLKLSNAAFVFPTNNLAKDHNGMTLHKFLGIGLDDSKLKVDNHVFRSNCGKYNTIVVDEITMILKHHAEFLHNNFNGTIYFLGDFVDGVSKQLPPVNGEGINKDFLDQFEHIHLTKNYRQDGDLMYYNTITNLRNGIEADYEFDEEIYDGVSPIIVTHNHDANRINDIYKNNDKLVVTLKQGCKSTTICRGELKVINREDIQPFHELAFAVTVHKVQGKTLNKCYLSKNCRFFEVNHKYVAYTRVRSGKDMKILKE